MEEILKLTHKYLPDLEKVASKLVNRNIPPKRKKKPVKVKKYIVKTKGLPDSVYNSMQAHVDRLAQPKIKKAPPLLGHKAMTIRKSKGSQLSRMVKRRSAKSYVPKRSKQQNSKRDSKQKRVSSVRSFNKKKDSFLVYLKNLQNELSSLKIPPFLLEGTLKKKKPKNKKRVKKVGDSDSKHSKSSGDSIRSGSYRTLDSSDMSCNISSNEDIEIYNEKRR